MTNDRIVQALKEQYREMAGGTFDYLAKLIIPNKEPNKPKISFLKVFLILLLMEKGSCI